MQVACFFTLDKLLSKVNWCVIKYNGVRNISHLRFIEFSNLYTYSLIVGDVCPYNWHLSLLHIKYCSPNSKILLEVRIQKCDKIRKETENNSSLDPLISNESWVSKCDWAKWLIESSNCSISKSKSLVKIRIWNFNFWILVKHK